MTETNCPAIEIDGLRKSYGDVPVLHGVTFQVAVGSLVGFLGPNGAGKSTTLRVLLGLLSGSGGSTRIFGEETRRLGHRLRSRVGYLPGEVNLYRGMTGLGAISHFARVRKTHDLRHGLELAEKFGLNLQTRVRRFSSGMKQKLGLILAMMHRPELLILDEPTSALDPLVRQTVFSELTKVVREGRTVLFSSHSLNEVEELCDDVVILREGLVVETNSIEKLKQKALRKVEVRFQSDPPPLPNEFQVRDRSGPRVEGVWKGTAETLLRFLSGAAVSEFSVERPDLEDLFLSYYSSPRSPSDPDLSVPDAHRSPEGRS